MTRELIVRPEAEDIDDAFRWYERQREGLGTEFLLCVEELLERIQRSPEMYAFVREEIRSTTVRRFPYAVYYLVEDESVVVIAVLHVRRGPSVWTSRS